MGKVYGRAYPITQADAKAYRRVDRSLKANPIGVTAMASVNGRGAAQSAREVSRGKTRSQMIARARQVYRNGEQSMLKNRKKRKRASTKRKKVPGTSYFRTSNGRYQTAKGKFVKASSVKKRKPAASKKRKKRVLTVASNRKVRRNRSAGYSSKYASGYDSTFKKRRKAAAKAVAAIPAPKATTKRRRRRAKTSGVIGPRSKGRVYKRVPLRDARTGRVKLSYMYKGKGGRLKRIPTKALLAAGYKQERIDRGRSKAASRVQKYGSAFVANKRKKAGKKRSSAKQKRAGRRLAAFMAARRAGNNKSKARAIALRKVPLQRGDLFRGEGRAPVTTTARRTRVRRNKKKSVRKNAKRRLKLNRRKLRRNGSTAMKLRTSAPKRKRLTSNRKKRRSTTRKRRRATRATARKTKRKRRKSTAGKTKSIRKRRKSRKVRRNGFKLFRRNGFGATLAQVLKTSLFVAGGFLVHRIATNQIVDHLLKDVQVENAAFQQWKKPLVGFGLAAVAIPVLGKVAPKHAMTIGAGMFASWIQSTLATILQVANQPTWAGAVSGYSNSRAYALRGNRRRRGLRGHQTSIMPRYAPLKGYMQAAAGWQQAAAGTGWQQAAAGEYFTPRGTGEYFSATGRRGVGEYFTATGEYFAPSGLKGVGSYEPAGQLAMQAAAGTHQVIRDGLRPDGDLDWALDVAEAAAGLGEGPPAQPSWQETRVPTESQWIPNGPLWAGELPVKDSQQTSELSAGILQRPGGNGILSGG